MEIDIEIDDKEIVFHPFILQVERLNDEILQCQERVKDAFSKRTEVTSTEFIFRPFSLLTGLNYSIKLSPPRLLIACYPYLKTHHPHVILNYILPSAF